MSPRDDGVCPHGGHGEHCVCPCKLEEAIAAEREECAKLIDEAADLLEGDAEAYDVLPGERGAAALYRERAKSLRGLAKRIRRRRS